MNERDELVEDFRRFLAANYPCTCEAGTDCDAEREEAEALVKTVEIRGYRKPRTITTAEELDALEAGSVILCEGDRTGESVDTQALTLAPTKPPATGFHWRNHWITYFSSGMLDDFETVTVLWEPK